MKFLEKLKSWTLSSKTDAFALAKIVEDYFDDSNLSYYSGAIYNASTLWGFYFAKAKFRVYKKNQGKIIEIEDGDALKLFVNPYEYETWWEMAYKIPVLFAFFGRAVFLIYRNRDYTKSNGKITDIQLLPPQTYKIECKDGKVKYYVINNGKEIEVPINNILDIKYPNPFSNMDGHPIIQSIFDLKTVEKIQLKYMQEYWKTGGFMGLTFTTEQNLSKAQFDALLNRLRERYEGSDRAFKIGLLTSGLKPVKTAYSMRDHDMTEQRQRIRDEIYEAFKVNRLLVGGAGSNRAEADAQIYNFTSSVIEPLLSYLDLIFTKFVKENYDKNLFVQHDSITPKDIELKLRTYESGLKNGWLTINEVRDLEGWTKYPYNYADKPFINVGGALIDISIGAQITDIPIADINQNTDSKNMINKNIERQDFLAQIERRHEYWTRRFGRKLTEYYYDQQRRVLDAVLNNYLIENAFNLENENLIVWQLLESDLWDIMKEGWNYGDMLYNANNVFKQEAFREELELWKQNYAKLNQALYEELQKLDSLDKMKEKYNEYLNNNVNSIAVTTVTASLNVGMLQAMKDAGIRYKMWLTYRDERVRNRIRGENHVIMDGVVVPVDSYFQLQSRSGVDYALYPGDPALKPENLVNCRCTIIGVL